jgi:hypothetical protein
MSSNGPPKRKATTLDRMPGQHQHRAEQDQQTD